MITVARMVDLSCLCEAYHLTVDDDKSDNYILQIIRVTNTANYLAVYGKILLGFATFVSVMCLVEELGKFNNPDGKVEGAPSSGR